MADGAVVIEVGFFDDVELVVDGDDAFTGSLMMDGGSETAFPGSSVVFPGPLRAAGISFVAKCISRRLSGCL